MASNQIKYDGGFQDGAGYGAQQFTVPVQDGPKRVSYPFKNGPVPDAGCIVTERDFVVRKSYDVELINATTLNGGFETAGGGGSDVFANWAESIAASGTLSRDTTEFYSGTASAKYAATSGLLSSVILTQYVTTPGKTYRVSCWGKASEAGLQAVMIQDNGSLVANNTLTTSWAKYSCAYTAASALFEVRLYALINKSVWVDDVTLTEIDSVEAFDESAIMGVSKSFTNKFLYSSDLTNAAWVKTSSGTGSAPVVTAGFTGPDGALPAWRVQLDYGAGSGTSGIYQYAATTSNPHSQAFSFWYKSNTGSDQIFAAPYLDAGSTTIKLLTATKKWKQFSITNTVNSIDSLFFVRTYSTDGSQQVIDILISAVQIDFADYIGPFISTTSAEVTRSLPYVDGVSTPKIYDNFTFIDYDADSLSFIVGESDPQPTGVGNLVRFTRRFARIPANQVRPSSKWIQRPVLDGVKSGTHYAASFGNQKYSHAWNGRKSVTRVASTPASTIAAAMPGTNIVFTDSGAHVVNLPANSSAAAATAALAAGLTSLTGISVAVGTGWLNLVWTGTMTSIVPPTGVYVAGIGGNHAELASSGNQNTPATTLFEVPSHGGIVGDRMAMWAGDALVGKAVVVAVIDANNVSVMTSDLSAADSQVTYVAFSSDATYCVTNGPKLCSTRTTKRFYLPGYTTGITTAADITPPATDTDPESWLAAIVAGTAWVVDSVDDLKSWEGPILVQESSEIQMSDAIDTATP